MPDNPLKSPSERMYQCLTAENLTWREKVCLALIAKYDGPGGAFPSRKKLAEEMKLNQITDISIITAQMEKKGVLAKQERPGKTPVYSIQYDNLTRRENTTPHPSGKYYPTRRETTTPPVGKPLPIRRSEEESKDNPPTPLVPGGRQRRGKQGTLEITAEGVRGFLKDNITEE